ncbi:MAG: DUF2791 family P-loop domain-containing protein [Thermoplasmata archaeon]|nr:DUF2791 family P-loop domain-containing protein [Thermoplasmata archaeon]
MVVDAETLDFKFVGREKELEELTKDLNEAQGGKGKLIVVSGEAGIGKTTLLEEVGRRALEQGFEVLKGRCLTLQQTDPYHPFLDALKGKLKVSGRAEEPVEHRELPLGLIGMRNESRRSGAGDDLPLGLIPISETAEADLSEIDIQGEKDRMFNTILETIMESSKERPLMLFIDDFQWADTGTIQLMFHVGRNIVNDRVMLCCAFRPEEMDTDSSGRPFTQIHKSIGRGTGHRRIMLERMSQNEISQIIKNIIGIKDVPEIFLNKLHEECEGNPFFVEEVLGSLMDERIIHRHSHIWDAGVDISAIRIPSTIKDSIHHRIARLDESSKKMLRYGSVAGDRFSFDVLKKATGMDEERLLDSLESLIEADIIQEVVDSEEEEFIFVHKLTRGVIYETMSKSRVRLMHKSIGEVIEKVYSGNLEPMIYDLARHFTIGKDFARSYKYSVMAGDKALRTMAFEDAVGHYNTAFRTVDLLKGTEGDWDEEKLKLAMKIGNIHYWMNVWSAAEKFYRTALRLSEKAGNKRAISKALIALAHSERSAGNYQTAEKRYERAAEMSKELDDAQILAEIERGLGYVHWRKGENDDAVEHYNQSISLSMKAGDLSIMAKTFIELGNVYNQWGELEKSIEYYTKALVELEKLNEFSELARAYNNIGDSYLKMNKWDEAIENFDKCQEAAKKIGNQGHVAWANFNSAEALAYKGELDEAERRTDIALKICEAQDDKIGMYGVFKVKGVIYRIKKDWDRAVENFNKSVVILEMLDIPYDLGNTYFELGRTYEKMGESMAAISSYSMAKELFENVGAKGEAKNAADKIKLLESK